MRQAGRVDPFASTAELTFPHAVVVTDARGPIRTHGEVDESFRWASVTKLLTAAAALVAVQRHLVALEDPVGPPGATLAHLLAHASGVGPDSDAPVAAPGRRRVYSNRGFEILADHVAEGVGTDFGDWLEESVLMPLGLSTVLLEGSPAHGARGSAADLARLGRELLAPTLLEPELFARATTVAFPGLTGVLPGFGRQDPNDWGLGFEIRDGKAPHWTGAGNDPATFGHFGQSGSFLWVDPRAGIATAFLGAEPFGEWAARVWPRLSDAVLAERG